MTVKILIGRMRSMVGRSKTCASRRPMGDRQDWEGMVRVDIGLHLGMRIVRVIVGVMEGGRKVVG